MNTVKKLFLAGVALVVCLGNFAGCDKTKHIDHNAVLYDNASEWMRSEFLESNMTQGAGPYSEDSSSDDETLPQQITHIVVGREKFDEIFLEFPPNVDFENEMLIIYITTNFYMGNSYQLRNLTVKNGILSVKMQRKSSKTVAHMASAPRQRCFVIKMDKQIIADTNIELK